MGLFGKNKEKLLKQDKELLEANLKLMESIIAMCDVGKDDGNAFYYKRLNDAKAMMAAFDPFDETYIINIDKKINEHLEKFEQLIRSAGGSVSHDVKAAITDLQDLINSRNDVE